MDIVCYEIGDTCHYVTRAQDNVLQKFEGEQKIKFIKRTAFTSGKLGEPIKSSSGALAIVYPEGKGPGEVEESSEEPSEEVEESPQPSEAEISGVHL